ncbi:MAG: DNA/RNA non-specific endonuclease [Bacteroidales bacterium]|nr:DNA/RNA non-specific endonuclease [Bacteroidales bacterium]
MKHYRLLLLFTVLACAMTACEQPEPEPVRQTVSVSPTSLSFPEEGGTLSLSVSSNGAWYVQTQGDWFKASNYAGSGNGTVDVTANPNAGNARSSSIVISAGEESVTVSVSQEAHKVRNATIKEVRSYYKGSDYKITEDIFVDGVVISDYRRDTDGGLNNYSSAKTIILSDGEAGLMLYCSNENKDFARGDKVRVSLRDQTLSVYQNGPVQVNGLPVAKIEKIGSEKPVAKEITLDDLLSGNFESMYVAVKDVQVKEDFIGKTFVRKDNGKAVNTSIGFEGKDGNDFDLFTSQYAVFGDVSVPTGSGVLKGIAGKYGARIQMSISELGDFAGLTGARFATGTHFSLSFTEYPAWGDAGSFDVTLSSDVEWTSSSSDAGFTLSPDKGTGPETITVSFNDNPSSSEVRTAVITFKAVGGTIAGKEVTLTVTQQPFEVLNPSMVQPWMEMPAIPAGVGDKAFFTHDMTYNGAKVRNYSFWLDLRNRVSLWVAYPLYKGMTNGSSRTDKWAFDPIVPRRYQGDASRSYSRYDRGHQLPSADRLCTDEANEQTFYFTNITPQNADLNQGIWETLEKKVRDQISSSDTLYVVTGCGFDGGTPANFAKDARGNDVAVPDYYYKVILKYKAGSANGGYSAIGFVLENKAYGEQTIGKAYAKTVDEVEKLTGLDFFVNLKDEWQKEAESRFDTGSWGL